MVTMDSFKTVAGDIDWKAYRKAQIDAGERCQACNGYISIFGARIAGPRSCDDCMAMHTRRSEVTHPSRVRCPHCEHRFPPELDLAHALYSDLEPTELSCPSCDKEFAVKVRFTISYESPPLNTEGE